jgi:hypothetical protein
VCASGCYVVIGTSDRNELSSSGSLTCATSKNLNCHFSRVSFFILCVATLITYRSDCHAAATVPCSPLPNSKSYRHLGEALGRYDQRTNAHQGLARPSIDCCLLRSPLRSPFLFFITPISHFNYFFVRHHVHERPSLRLTHYTCATHLTTLCPRVSLL